MADLPWATESFSSALARLLTRDSRSVGQIAREAGLHPSLLSRFLDGTRGPSALSIEALAEVLDLPCTERDRLRVIAGFAPRDPLAYAIAVLESPDVPAAGRQSASTAALYLRRLRCELGRGEHAHR